MTDNYLIRTNYYSRPWTWLKTIILVIVFTLALVLWDMVEQETTYFWIKYIVFIVVTFRVVTAPVDDIALDNKNLYYLKTSLLPFMSKDFIQQIINLVKSYGFRLKTKNEEFIEPELSEITKSLVGSNAHKFVTDPLKFFDDFQKGIIKPE